MPSSQRSWAACSPGRRCFRCRHLPPGWHSVKWLTHCCLPAPASTRRSCWQPGLSFVTRILNRLCARYCRRSVFDFLIPLLCQGGELSLILHSAFIRGWAVDRRHRNIVQPEIDPELRAMMHVMVEDKV